MLNATCYFYENVCCCWTMKLKSMTLNTLHNFCMFTFFITNDNISLKVKIIRQLINKFHFQHVKYWPHWVLGAVSIWQVGTEIQKSTFSQIWPLTIDWKVEYLIIIYYVWIREVFWLVVSDFFWPYCI